jgi:hypothetical protein
VSRFSHLEGLVAVSRFTDHLKSRLAFQEQTKSLPQNGVIIRKQDAQRVHG